MRAVEQLGVLQHERDLLRVVFLVDQDARLQRFEEFVGGGRQVDPVDLLPVDHSRLQGSFSDGGHLFLDGCEVVFDVVVLAAPPG